MTSSIPTSDVVGAAAGAEVLTAASRNVWIKRLLIGASVLAVLFVIGYLVLISTAWGHEVDNDAYFGREGEPRYLVTTGNQLLSRVTAGVMALGLLFLIGLAALRRIFVVGLIAGIGVGIAMIGAQLFKALLPWSALVPSDAQMPLGLQRETYPSGHTTIGMSMTLAVLLIIPASARWWAAPITAFGAALFGVGVVIAGWHRPSDAIGGAFWSGFVMTLAACVAVWMRGCECDSPLDAQQLASQRRLSRILSAVGACCFFVIVVGFAVFAHNGLPDADRAFVGTIGLVLIAVFGVQSWFATTLSPISFRPKNPGLGLGVRSP